MKAIVGIILAAALGLGAAAYFQKQKTETLKQQVEAERLAQTEAEQARREQEKQLQMMALQKEHLENRMADLSSEVSTLRASQSTESTKPGDVAPALASPAPDAASAKEGPFGKGMSEMMKKMFDDPAMRESKRKQMKTMINKQYGALFKELNLTPEEREKFTELLLDKQMAAGSRAADLFDANATNRVETVDALKDDAKDTEASLKELLGEDRFAQYQDYTKSLADRMALDQFRQSLSDGAELGEGQAAQLLQVMREERSQMPRELESAMKGNGADLRKMMDGDAMEKVLQFQEEMNQRVLQRSAGILSPEQLQQLEEFQTQQLNMQKLGIQMMKGMFGSESQGSTAAPAR